MLLYKTESFYLYLTLLHFSKSDWKTKKTSPLSNYQWLTVTSFRNAWQIYIKRKVVHFMSRVLKLFELLQLPFNRILARFYVKAAIS